MKLKTRFSDKQVKAWMKERDEASKSYDVKKFRKFYSKWLAEGMYAYELPKDDRIIEVMMRKMVYHIKSSTEEQRREAKEWLQAHGSTTNM